MARFASFLVMTLLSMVLLGTSSHAQVAPAAPNEDQLRASYVAGFGSYIEWPAAAFADAEAPFVIGVMDDEPMLRLLEAGFKSRKLQGRQVQVRRIDSILQATRIHMLYLPEGNSASLRPLNGLSVLTVGAGTAFLDRGGVIGLLMHKDRLRFEFNAKAAERSGLKVSAKLQQLALNTYEELR